MNSAQSLFLPTASHATIIVRSGDFMPAFGFFRQSISFGLAISFGLVSFSLLTPDPNWAAQKAAAASSPPGELTVDLIYAKSSLNGKLTHGISWTQDSKKLSYFVVNDSGKEPKTELWVIDPVSGARSILLSSDILENILPAPAEKQSQATGLGRHAPAQYQWAPSGDALLFEGPHSLSWYNLKTQQSRVLVNGEDDLADAKISPDGRYVSFVKDHNIWLVSTADAKQRALTLGGTEEFRKGELDWVYPEELDISTAYWWAPDSSNIAFLEMDERKVTQFSLLNFESFTGEAELQRYPVPGGSNPLVRVFTVPVAGGEPRLLDTGSNPDVYIPRVNWLPDSKHVAIQRLNREQTILDLLLADSSTGKSTTLLTEKDAYWINVSDDLYFFKDGNRFLWSSERSGYRHLYLYDLAGKQLAQLTKGDWEVSHLSTVDEAKGLVYFSAAEKSPLERHLYSVTLDGSGFSRLTKQPGTHSANFAPDSSLYLDTFSDANTPPRQDLFHADGSKLFAFNENKVAELSQYHLSPVEFFTVKSHDGVLLNCSMIKPPNFDPTRRYPVLVYTYGGPHAQVVLNQWTGNTELWHQMMAQKGYIVFSLDNRGSAGRGHLFEEPIHFRLGAQELSDQRDGVAWLRLQSFVDPDRVGIWGWSYGGHMTLHAIFEAPEIFKAAFAGGPVTDWHFYDTIYTERYIGLLPLHEEDYQESSPISSANRLRRKLLIAHGTGDDNVHYSNTLSLIDELIKDGKYVEVMAFPGRGHGVNDMAARRILMQRVTQFFLDNL
jgi:dipeptidyl-peptidase 4